MTTEEAQERSPTEQMAALGNLIAALAHEVRTPLSTILLNLQLVKEDFAEAEGAKERRSHKRLSVVEDEVRRLQWILEEFLRFARMPDPKLQDTDLNELLQSIVDFTAAEMQERNVSLRFYPDPSLPPIPVDRDLFRAAIINLLRNAFDACRNGDEVLVSTRREDDAVIVRVLDTGPGMAPEVRARAFHPYFSTKKTGTGLGLPTVRKIVLGHHGSIDLTSEIGRGTQFSVRLPLRQAAVETDSMRSEDHAL